MRKGISGTMRNLVGYIGELVVIVLIKLRRQQLLYHRYRSPLGEIDIITKKASHLTFVEVKSSISSQFREVPINNKKRRTIIRTAKLFLARHPQYRNYQISFEVYCVSFTNGITRFEHAWYE